jgi:hypothetical protein
VTRRLSKEEAAAALSRAVPIPEGRRAPRRPRTALRGLDPRGVPREARLEVPGLVLFLSTTCDGCRELAELVREGVAGCDVIGALRLPPEGLPSEATASFIGDGGRWLLGDDAFDAFDVRAAPFFCVIDAAGSVAVEGVAFGRGHVVEHCGRVLAGAPRPDAVRLDPERR